MTATILGIFRALLEAIEQVSAYLRARMLKQAGEDAQKVEQLTEGQRRVQEANSARLRARDDAAYRDRLRERYAARPDD